MNWKLIFSLSLFGLAMGFATVFLIPSYIEPAFWLVIFCLCAYIIARRCPNMHFLHGFMVSIVNSLWITAAHAIFMNQYLANHPQEAAMMTSMPLQVSPRVILTMMGLIAGAVSGLVLGLLAWIAGKLTKRVAGSTMAYMPDDKKENPPSPDPNDSDLLRDKIKGQTKEHPDPPRLEDEGQSGG